MNPTTALMTFALLLALSSGARANHTTPFDSGRWNAGNGDWRGDRNEMPPPPPVGRSRELDTLQEFSRLEAEALRWADEFRRAPSRSRREQDAERQLRYTTNAAKDLLSAPGALARYPWQTLETFGLQLGQGYQQARSGSALEDMYLFASRAAFGAAFESFSREVSRYSPRELYDMQRLFDQGYTNARSRSAAESFYKRARDLVRAELDRPQRPPRPVPPQPMPPPPAPYPPAPNPVPNPRRPRRDWQYDRVQEIARQVDMAAESSYGAARALSRGGRDEAIAIEDLNVLAKAARRLSNDLDQWRTDPSQTQADYYAVVDGYAAVRRSSWYPQWHRDVQDNLRNLEKRMGDLEYYYPER